MLHDYLSSFNLFVAFRIITREQFDINFQFFAHEFSEIEDKLNVAIKDQDFEKFMQLSNILIKRIDCFFNFRENNEDEISHLEKTIYNHQNVAIRDSHEDIESQKAHIIHENIASSAFERRKRAQSILITRTR
jgi:methyl coenzyme M reductase gamma subunit